VKRFSEELSSSGYAPIGMKLYSFQPNFSPLIKFGQKISRIIFRIFRFCARLCLSWSYPLFLIGFRADSFFFSLSLLPPTLEISTSISSFSRKPLLNHPLSISESGIVGISSSNLFFYQFPFLTLGSPAYSSGTYSSWTAGAGSKLGNYLAKCLNAWI